MTDAKYERELGGISVSLQTISSQQSAIFNEINALKKLIADQNANGCAQGKRHAADIAELKNRPGRMIELGACIIAIAAAAIAWIKGG